MEKFEVGNVTLTAEDIDDIMVSVLEGGITSMWCRKVEPVGQYLGEWASEQISRGGKLLFFNIDNGRVYGLDRGSFLKGFELWLENGGDLFGAVSDGEVDPCKIDAVCADAIIQYAIWGELVYG